jgi:hypothetical protein
MSDCNIRNQIAREIDYVARMQDIIYTKRRQQRLKNVALEPYNTPPEGSLPFNLVGSIDGAGAGGLGATFVIAGERVPFGWDIYLQTIMTQYTGTNLVPTSGDIEWALRIDGLYIQGYNHITAEYGDFSFGLKVNPGVLAKSGQLIEIVATLVQTFTPDGGSKVIAGVSGIQYANGIARSN